MPRYNHRFLILLRNSIREVNLSSNSNGSDFFVFLQTSLSKSCKTKATKRRKFVSWTTRSMRPPMIPMSKIGTISNQIHRSSNDEGSLLSLCLSCSSFIFFIILAFTSLSHHITSPSLSYLITARSLTWNQHCANPKPCSRIAAPSCAPSCSSSSRAKSICRISNDSCRRPMAWSNPIPR